MNKLAKIKEEILKDHQQNDNKDGLFSISDKLDIEKYSEYKAAVNALNEDTSFPYTVYIQLKNNAVKIQYSPLGSKFYEYKKPSEVIEVLERLTDRVKRLEADNNISHSTYAKEGRDGLNILIESLDGREHLDISITNTFKEK